MFLAPPGSLFRRQSRLSALHDRGGLILLRLDRFAFPTPRHMDNYSFSCNAYQSPEINDRQNIFVPSCDFRQSEIANKNIYSRELCVNNAP